MLNLLETHGVACWNLNSWLVNLTDHVIKVHADELCYAKYCGDFFNTGDLDRLNIGELILYDQDVWEVNAIGTTCMRIINGERSHVIEIPCHISGKAYRVNEYKLEPVIDYEAIEKILNISYDKDIIVAKRHIEQLTYDMGSLKDTIETYKRRIIDLKESIDEEYDSIKRLEEERLTNAKKNIDKLLNEIKLIKTFPKIKDVEINNDEIKVYTNPLRIFEPVYEHYYFLGEMLFVIPHNINNLIRIYNLTDRRCGYSNDMHHPHIFRDGNPCLGNASDVFSLYRDSKDYAMLVNAIIQFCESVDIEDVAGNYVASWDEIDENWAVIKEANGIHTVYSEYGQCAICGEELDEDYYYCECCDRRVCYDCWNTDFEMCDRCAEHYAYCDVCDDVYHEEYLTEIDGCAVCNHCLEYETERCGVCGEVHLRRHTTTVEDVIMCPTCYERHLEEENE